MHLLLDNDAFCKLALAGLLHQTVHQLELNISDCRKLPSLPHMLRRGKLRAHLGDQNADSLINFANSIDNITSPNVTLVDSLTSKSEIDAGEALIFASAAENKSFLITGDKRALSALRSINPYPQALDGRIVLLESALLSLCKTTDVENIRKSVQTIKNLDKVVSICFSPGVSNPKVALESYFNNAVNEFSPLNLWKP
jgi:hypothetical protein